VHKNRACLANGCDNLNKLLKKKKRRKSYLHKSLLKSSFDLVPGIALAQAPLHDTKLLSRVLVRAE
jgi:hypothetical protein